MSDYGILLVAFGIKTIEPPQWVTEFDPDDCAEGTTYPTGMLYSDVNSEKAKRFSSITEAREYYTQQSTRTPYRPDGRPNKPMTVFTVEIKEITE